MLSDASVSELRREETDPEIKVYSTDSGLWKLNVAAQADRTSGRRPRNFRIRRRLPPQLAVARGGRVERLFAMPKANCLREGLKVFNATGDGAVQYRGALREQCSQYGPTAKGGSAEGLTVPDPQYLCRR
jgi:hypothetical protein